MRRASQAICTTWHKWGALSTVQSGVVYDIVPALTSAQLQQFHNPARPGASVARRTLPTIAAVRSASGAAASSSQQATCGSSSQRNGGWQQSTDGHTQGLRAALGWAAGGLALLAAGLGTARCEAPPPASQDPLSALASAKARLLPLWQSLDMDAHRAEAALPLRDRARRCGPPQIRLVNGGQLAVRFQVRAGADLAATCMDAVSAVSGCSAGPGSGRGKLSVELSESGAARVLEIRPRPPSDSPSPVGSIGGGGGATPSSSSSAPSTSGGGGHDSNIGSSGGCGCLWATLFLPLVGDGPAEVEFFKEGGAMTDPELNAVSAVLATANTIQAGGRPGGGGGGDFFGRALESFMPGAGELLRNWPTSKDMHRMQEEFERMLKAHQEQQDDLSSKDGPVQSEIRIWRWPPAGDGDEAHEEDIDDEDDSMFNDFLKPTLPPPSPHGRRRPSPFGHESLGQGPSPDGGGNGDIAPGGGVAGQQQQQQRTRVAWDSPKGQALVRRIQGKGGKVFLPEAKDPSDQMDWQVLAGYEEQKRAIEDTVLLALRHPDVYDGIAAATRKRFATNRPRGVLFEGPPGCGKTTSARVMASQAAVPLVYVPLEAIVSKWYGESERNLSDMLGACEGLDGCIVFLDELDSLATSRNTEMHEATRRVLGVLLRHMDGLEQGNRSVVIGATNRMQDLDPALLSRFDTTVVFDLPTKDCRASILEQYARQLPAVDLQRLADATPGFSGRDLRDVCEQTERRWASKVIKHEVPAGELPGLGEYLLSAAQRGREKASQHVTAGRGEIAAMPGDGSVDT